MSALASLERFGEKDPLFKKGRSCRDYSQSEWALDSACNLIFEIFFKFKKD
jgi:hypothetical protein